MLFVSQPPRRGSRLFLVGAQPPPVHGMALVNAAIRERLQGRCELEVINLSAPDLIRTVRKRVRRLATVAHGTRRFVSTARPDDKLYISISGGLGQAYEIAFLAAARRLGIRCYLHHHSYSYLDTHSPVTALLARVAGNAATHVVLSHGMADRLIDQYGRRRVIHISNAALVMSDSSPAPVRQELRTVGFIGNISAEKGVFDFLDLMRTIEAQSLPITAMLAGPFQDSATEKQVKARLTTLRSTTYLGPRYGADKNAFFRSIDTLIFPTRYVNEAEPLTIHEALMHGVPVIAFGRGAIPELLSPGTGLTISVGDDFVVPAVTKLREWVNVPSRFRAASAFAGTRFHQVRSESTARWAKLEAELVDASD
jgi:glycosyltransferase involved in cell wall biosynthesis